MMIHNERWRTFCRATGRQIPEVTGWGPNDNNLIANISWNEAVEYCEWLSRVNNVRYCLPTGTVLFAEGKLFNCNL